MTIPNQLPVLQLLPSVFHKLIGIHCPDFLRGNQEVNVLFYPKTRLIEAVLSTPGFILVILIKYSMTDSMVV